MMQIIAYILSMIILAGCCLIPKNENCLIDQQLAAETNLKLAIGFLNQDYIKEAKEKFLLAERLNPDNPMVLSSIGYFHFYMGDISRATAYYKKAIAIAPTDGQAHNNYAILLYQQGQYHLAMEHFLIAIADPNYLDVAAAYENAAYCAKKLHNTQLVAKYYQRACALR